MPRSIRLPDITGIPVRIEYRPGLRAWRGQLESGSHRGHEILGASFIRRRTIVLDSCLRSRTEERARVYVHELFHFVWVRLGNPARRLYEDVLLSERRRKVPGELGWSAEWRKAAIRPLDVDRRHRRWREYVCESFCDTAAWLFAAGAPPNDGHDEFTLPARERRRRAAWFRESGLTTRISI